MQVHDVAKQTWDVIVAHTGIKVSPRSGNFGTCLMAAMVAALPVIIKSLLECMAGGGGGGGTGYDPGDRTRCD